MSEIQNNSKLCKRRNQEPEVEDSDNSSEYSHEQCRKRKKVLEDGNEDESYRVEDNEKNSSHKASGETESSSLKTGKETETSLEETNTLFSDSGATALTYIQEKIDLREAPSSLTTASSANNMSDSRNCSICLKNFTTQEVGTPDSCTHNFCLSCLQQWVKKNIICPVGLQAFTAIVVRSCLDGKVTGRIPVEPPKQKLMTCDICQTLDSEDHMFMCLECEHYCHLECLDPPTNTLPLEDRSCPNCNQNGLSDSHQEPRCGICNLEDPMLICWECHQSYHLECLDPPRDTNEEQSCPNCNQSRLVHLHETPKCSICREGDRLERMLICMKCNHNYHLECLDPPTDTVPVGERSCPNCDHTSLINPNEEPHCSICSERIQQDSMIICMECENYYHRECMDPSMDNEPLESWECPSCKKRGLYNPNQHECEVCWESNNQDRLLFCSECLVYFHHECLETSDNKIAPLEGRHCPDCNHTRLIKPDLIEKEQ